jgi:amidase
MLTRQDHDVGPLAGLDFAVKDLFDLAGHAKTCGQPRWAETHAPAERDAAAIARCLDAGARLTGRTVMDELAYSLSGQNPHHGAPTNPNAPGRTAGGSSCGSAAAVAGGLVDFALGTDTGGSVRVPASYCGCAGLRPSHGAVPLDGATALAPSFDTAGWFARDTDVLQAVGAVLLPADAEGTPEAPTGVSVAQDALALAEPDAAAVLAPWIERLRQRLGTVADVSLGATPDHPDDSLHDWARRFRLIQAREAAAALGGWVDRAQPEFGPEMAERWRFVGQVTDDAAEAARAEVEDLRRHLEALTAGGRVIALPAAPGPAPALDGGAAAWQLHRTATLALTCAASLAGLPQLSLPVARLLGYPVGLGLIAPRGADRMLLALATRLLPAEPERDPGAVFD